MVFISQYLGSSQRRIVCKNHVCFQIPNTADIIFDRRYRKRLEIWNQQSNSDVMLKQKIFIYILGG